MHARHLTASSALLQSRAQAMPRDCHSNFTKLPWRVAQNVEQSCTLFSAPMHWHLAHRVYDLSWSLAWLFKSHTSNKQSRNAGCNTHGTICPSLDRHNCKLLLCIIGSDSNWPMVSQSKAMKPKNWYDKPYYFVEKFDVCVDDSIVFLCIKFWTVLAYKNPV